MVFMRGEVNCTAQDVKHAAIDLSSLMLAEPLIDGLRILVFELLNGSIPQLVKILGDPVSDSRDPF